MITLQEICSLFPNIKDMEKETWHTKAYKVAIDVDVSNNYAYLSYYIKNYKTELDFYLYKENPNDADGEIGLCLDDGQEQIAWCWIDINDLNKNETTGFLQYCTVLRETAYTF